MLVERIFKCSPRQISNGTRCVLENEENSKYVLGMYSTILGGSAMSKLFQNVRERKV